MALAAPRQKIQPQRSGYAVLGFFMKETPVLADRTQTNLRGLAHRINHGTRASKKACAGGSARV